MKWKGLWCLIHVSLLFIARFVTQTGQYDLRGGNLQTAFWKPSFSMLWSNASSPAEPCWNLNSWHWLATSQQRRVAPQMHLFQPRLIGNMCFYLHFCKPPKTYLYKQFIAVSRQWNANFYNFHTNDLANWLVNTCLCCSLHDFLTSKHFYHSGSLTSTMSTVYLVRCI